MMRPGEPPTAEAAEALFHNLFFAEDRYDLSSVGRMKFDTRFVEDKFFKLGLERTFADPDFAINTEESGIVAAGGYIYAKFPQIIDTVKAHLDEGEVECMPNTFPERAADKVLDYLDNTLVKFKDDPMVTAAERFVSKVKLTTDDSSFTFDRCIVLPISALELKNNIVELPKVKATDSRGKSLAFTVPNHDLHEGILSHNDILKVMRYLIKIRNGKETIDGWFAQTKEMEAMGVSVGPKHFFANDQETWRTGVSTYGNEQGFREIQLRAFEGCFTQGILRGEWGFIGIVITDAAGVNSYMHTVGAIMNGTDMFCYTSGVAADGRTSDINAAIRDNDDGYIIEHLKEINHRIYYTYAHTNLMNGLSSMYDVVTVTPWWQPVVIVINCVFGAAAVGLCIAFVAYAYGKKNKKQEVAGNVQK